ncbi:MAG: hypothetical protein EHM79_15360 [Geobacter sp.]|nr:MAG: hypothetical protein EHM79_15360 [Geobacter sp.]
MDTSILETFDLHQFCQAYLKGLSTPCGSPDKAWERRKRLLEGLSDEELEGLARQVEVQLVYQRLGFVFATSSCGNCENYEYCNERRANRFSVEQSVNIEPWTAFLCNRYEPDVMGLHRETMRLKEITAQLKAIGLPVDEEIVGQCLEQATQHWFHQLKLTRRVGLSVKGNCLS